jgi:hypothetical protein
VGVQSVVLEHHRDVSVLGRYVVNDSVADEQFTFGDLFKTCDHTQSGGLTATGRTYEYDEFLILYFQAEVGYGGNAAGILFINVLKR